MSQPGHQPVTREEWAQACSECSWVTFFETPDWFDVWARNMAPSGKPMAFRIYFSDGNSALIPTLKVARMLGTSHHFEISPGGNYGGPIATTPLNTVQFAEIQRFLSVLGNYSYRLNPYAISEFNGNGIRYDFTQSIDLVQPDDELEKKLGLKRVSSYAAKLRDEDYLITRLQPEGLPFFFEIYREAQKRWHKVNIRYPLEFFESLYQTPGCDFWGVFDGSNQLIGGGPVLHTQNIAVSWLPLVSEEAQKKHAFEFFYHDLIWHYKNQGLKWFDFNPSGGNDGVIRFKSKFQPEKISAPFFYGKSGWVKLAEMVLGR